MQKTLTKKEIIKILRKTINVIENRKGLIYNKLRSTGIFTTSASATSSFALWFSSLFGTASTGTAISSLSGAALNSASMAFIGGSVLTGTIIVNSISVVTGFLVLRFLSKKTRNKEIDKEFQELHSNLVNALNAIQDRNLSKYDIHNIYKTLLLPLKDQLEEKLSKIGSWSYARRVKYRNIISKIDRLISVIPKVSSLELSILGSILFEKIGDYVNNREIVIEAIRRSSNNLQLRSEDSIIEYINSLEPNSLKSFVNNIKGIYHELLYKHNLEDQGFIVEIFEETNHPGSDLIIKDHNGKLIEEIQLKATDNLQYIKQHFDKYPDIPVFATKEIADQLDNVKSTEILNEELVDNIEYLIESDDLLNNIISSTIISTVAEFLRKRKLSKESLKPIIQSSIISIIINEII